MSSDPCDAFSCPPELRLIGNAWPYAIDRLAAPTPLRGSRRTGLRFRFLCVCVCASRRMFPLEDCALSASMGLPPLVSPSVLDKHFQPDCSPDSFDFRKGRVLNRYLVCDLAGSVLRETPDK